MIPGQNSRGYHPKNALNVKDITKLVLDFMLAICTYLHKPGNNGHSVVTRLSVIFRCYRFQSVLIHIIAPRSSI